MNFLHQVVIGLQLLQMAFMQVMALLLVVLELRDQIGFFMINQNQSLQEYLEIRLKQKMELKFFLTQLENQKIFLIPLENQLKMNWSICKIW